MHGTRSVRQLLTRAFAVLVLLIVCAGLAEMTAVLLQHRVVNQLTTHVQPLQVANARLRTVLADAQRSLRGYLLTGDGQLLDTYHVARGEYHAAIGRLRELAVTGPERASVREQAERADGWWTLAERQWQAPPRSATAAGFVTEGKTLFQAFVAASDSLDQRLARRAASLQRRSATLGWLTVTAVSALTVVAAGLAVLTARRVNRDITAPLGRLVNVLERRRGGDRTIRADPDDGPAEIRAVAAVINTTADKSDRGRAAEQYVARLRADVRHLGYRIRAHLVVDDAIREAIDGLARILRADHVLIRLRYDGSDTPAIFSLHDEHLPGGPLSALAGCDLGWLDTGDAWTTDDEEPAGTVHPPDDERAACARIGDGPVLTVAISSGDECIGALTLIRDTGSPWTPVEVRLAEGVVADLGRGVHLARLYEHEQHVVARLKDLDTAKSDFMSTVSHELRTPLTSIAGYLELMLDEEAGALVAPQRRMLEVIARNTRRLRELIEDMLILSRIESGDFRIEKSEVELGSLVDNALAAIAPAAAKASVGVHTEIDRPLRLDADPEQLDRVLMNLLSNAVKFTPPEGTVTVRAGRDGDELVLSVADTGMGIPAAEQQALFARFFRASNAIHQAIPGTGLGLSIVRTIVDNHGGTIAVTSAERVGTTVTVRLPVTAGSS